MVLVQGLRADVNVMKDVTLGFGEALEKCREEVCMCMAAGFITKNLEQ